jgi:hypothetical protein
MESATQILETATPFLVVRAESLTLVPFKQRDYNDNSGSRPIAANTHFLLAFGTYFNFAFSFFQRRRRIYEI